MSVCRNNFMSIVWLIKGLKTEMVVERPGLYAETLPWGRSKFQDEKVSDSDKNRRPSPTHIDKSSSLMLIFLA